MSEGKFVGYIRVSTTRQGASGLGMKAQHNDIERYLNGGNWELLAEFVEVESGKNNDRPELRKALDYCKLTGATLVIARLDRLARNAHFLLGLQDAGVKFVAVDMPDANEMTVGIMAVVAQGEAKAISARTKAALAAAKERGTALGTPENLTKEAAAKGRAMGVKARQKKYAEHSNNVYPIIKDLADKGMSLRGIAKDLNSKNILTARGNTNWSAVTVGNVLKRAES